ncbi:hypothetical protein BJ508DRAFT_301678 [Ascobolus immersus RN42]|uniref:Uncharacterized protein n=1 Tax=Ascobolus immersus RN42 TaxID=1160509 RepID=A0A3N4IYZ9_ASCIM|nr:hypothetical protein BJ508DRAFT_301678 [Ascobolus immersus RN42]
MGVARHFSDFELSDDEFKDANSDVELDAFDYGANGLVESENFLGSASEDDEPSRPRFGLGMLPRAADAHSSDPFSFISQLDVRAYVAGGAGNRSGLGREKQEIERKETEEGRKKDLEQNKHILYQGNLVEDWAPHKVEDVLKFHKAGEAVEEAKELIELEVELNKVEISSPPRKHVTPIKGSAFVLPPRPDDPMSFRRSRMPDYYIQPRQHQQPQPQVQQQQQQQQHHSQIHQQQAYQSQPNQRQYSTIQPQQQQQHPSPKQNDTPGKPEEEDLTRIHQNGRPLWERKFEKTISHRRKEDLRSCPEGATWSIGAVEPMGLVDGEASGYLGLDQSLSSKKLFAAEGGHDDEEGNEKKERERDKRTPYVMQQFTREATLAAAQYRVATTKPKTGKGGQATPIGGSNQTQERQDDNEGWVAGEGGPKRNPDIVEWDTEFGFQHTNLVPKQLLPPPRPYSTYCKPPQKPDSPYYARPGKFAPPAALSAGKMVQKDGYTQFYAREDEYPFEEEGGVFTQRKTMVDYRDYGKKKEPGANHVFVPVVDYSHPSYSYMFGLGGGMPGGNNGGIIRERGSSRGGYRGGFGGGRSSRRDF